VGLVLALTSAASSAHPEAKMGMFAMPRQQQPGVVYIPRREAQQLLAMEQRLSVIYSPEAQTDMWIKIAEAIDHDAVNDPALPPVSDAISAEAAKAQAEQEAEQKAMQNGGVPGPFGLSAPHSQELVMGRSGQEFALEGKLLTAAAHYEFLRVGSQQPERAWYSPI